MFDEVIYNRKKAILSIRRGKTVITISGADLITFTEPDFNMGDCGKLEYQFRFTGNTVTQEDQ